MKTRRLIIFALLILLGSLYGERLEYKGISTLRKIKGLTEAKGAFLCAFRADRDLLFDINNNGISLNKVVIDRTNPSLSYDSGEFHKPKATYTSSSIHQDVVSNENKRGVEVKKNLLKKEELSIKLNQINPNFTSNQKVVKYSVLSLDDLLSIKKSIPIFARSNYSASTSASNPKILPTYLIPTVSPSKGSGAKTPKSTPLFLSPEKSESVLPSATKPKSSARFLSKIDEYDSEKESSGKSVVTNLFKRFNEVEEEEEKNDNSSVIKNLFVKSKYSFRKANSAPHKYHLDIDDLLSTPRKKSFQDPNKEVVYISHQDTSSFCHLREGGDPTIDSRLRGNDIGEGSNLLKEKELEYGYQSLSGDYKINQLFKTPVKDLILPTTTIKNHQITPMIMSNSSLKSLQSNKKQEMVESNYNDLDKSSLYGFKTITLSEEVIEQDKSSIYGFKELSVTGNKSDCSKKNSIYDFKNITLSEEEMVKQDKASCYGFQKIDLTQSSKNPNFTPQKKLSPQEILRYENLLNESFREGAAAYNFTPQYRDPWQSDFQDFNEFVEIIGTRPSPPSKFPSSCGKEAFDNEHCVTAGTGYSHAKNLNTMFNDISLIPQEGY